jgi:hypothetical protein
MWTLQNVKHEPPNHACTLKWLWNDYNMNNQLEIDYKMINV